MQKAKKYDWKDSNMALFGSDVEKKVKKESAESEPAWQGAGGDVGIKIWRIVKFEVTHWPEDQYGEFFNGDSYIILNTYKDEGEDELKHDVHFWIGKYSSQDEYATAAYKTVELDTFLDDAPVQHRQVQGHESGLFKSYFEALKLLKGGAATGFNRVLPEEYKPRMLHVKKIAKGRITATEVSLKKNKLSSDDVFIIDDGLKIYQWNGANCTHDEKFAASAEISKMKVSRSKATVSILDESSTSHSHPALSILKEGESKEKNVVAGEIKMFEVSDEDGSLDMDPVGEEGVLCKDNLNSNNVCIVNTGTHVFCWIGAGASIDERKNCFTYAHTYLCNTETPWLPVSVISEGKETADFKSAFGEW